MLIIPAILLLIITLYFSYCRSIKIITTLGVLLVSSYSIFIYFEHKNIYGSSTTFFDTIKREFYWVTPNFTIPDHATEIKNGAFKHCELLSNVTIGNSVTSIGKSAFCGYSSLRSVYCKAKTPPSGGPYMFDNNAWNIKIYVPRNSVKAYKSAKYWKEYADDIVGYDFE